MRDYKTYRSRDRLLTSKTKAQCLLKSEDIQKLEFTTKNTDLIQITNEIQIVDGNIYIDVIKNTGEIK